MNHQFFAFSTRTIPSLLALAFMSLAWASAPGGAEPRMESTSKEQATTKDTSSPPIEQPVPADWWGKRSPNTASQVPPREMTAQEKAVVERATRRQQLIGNGDYKGAYEFFSVPSRATKSLATFEAEIGASAIKELKATRAECDKDDRCTVTLVGKAALQQPRVGIMGVPVLLQEVWLLQPSGEAQLISR